METESNARLAATFDVDDRRPSVRAAADGLTPEEVAAAERLLARGRVAQDPRVARLVVALAGAERRHDLSLVYYWVSTLGLVAWASVRLLVGHRDSETWSAVGTAVVMLVITAAKSRSRARLPRVERANLDVVEASHLDTELEAPQTQPVGPAAAIRKTLPGYVFLGLIVGVLFALTNDHSLTLGRVAGFGLPFAGLMTALDLARSWYRAQFPD